MSQKSDLQDIVALAIVQFLKNCTFFKSLDFLGNAINFTINSNDTFKTAFGGFISLIIYFLYIFFFIKIGQDFLFKQNPSGNFQIKENKEDEKYIKVKDLNFLMGFQLQDENYRKINMEEYLFYFKKNNFQFRKIIRCENSFYKI